MAVHIKLSTTLRDFQPDYDPVKGLSVSYTGPMNAGDLACMLNLPLDEIKIIMVNHVHASLDQQLHDGDRIAYFPAVGGG